MKQNNVLYILSNGRLAAINKKDGLIIWEVKLKQYLSKGLSLGIGQISVENNKIFVGSTGVLLCLNSKDGSLVWKNELKGWGNNYVSMADVGNDAASASAMQSSSDAAIIAATM